MRLAADTDDVNLCVTFDWEMGHRLPNHEGACFNLHGHHYVLQVYLAGTVNKTTGSPSEGMVIDFQDVKQNVKWILADYYDHKFLISNTDALAEEMSRLPGVILVDYIPTAENIALQLKRDLKPHIPQMVALRLYETPGCYAEV